MSKLPKHHTISTDIKIYDIADPNVDDTEEALVLFLELFLIENLNGENAVLCRFPGSMLGLLATHQLQDIHVKDFIPIRIKGLLDHRCCSRLLATNSRNCERVWES